MTHSIRGDKVFQRIQIRIAAAGFEAVISSGHSVAGRRQQCHRDLIRWVHICLFQNRGYPVSRNRLSGSMPSRKSLGICKGFEIPGD